MSLGGMTAIVLAARAARAGAPPGPGRRHPGVNRRKAKAIIDFVDGPQSFPSFDAILARTIEHNPTRTESSLRRGILHNAHQLDDGSWAWNYDRGRRSRGRRSLPADDEDPPPSAALGRPVERIEAPLLLVRGGVSPVVDDDDVAELARRQPAAEVVVVDGAGHSVQGDRPLELAALIAASCPARSARRT